METSEHRGVNDARDFKNFQELIQELWWNYIYMAVDSSYIPSTQYLFHHDIYKDIEGLLRDFDPSKMPSKMRNVLIVGAGLSKSEYDNIPLAKEAIPKILKNFGIKEIDKGGDNAYHGSDSFGLDIDDRLKTFANDNDLDKFLIRKFQRELNSLLLYTSRKIEVGTDSFDSVKFEAILHALSQVFNEEDVRTKLSELFNYRQNAALSFALLAHLFKHRFIDVIINFNFDELLDLSIEDELGTENYNRIITEGDCGEFKDNYLIDFRLKEPLYIKPHGTFSHGESLKFTRHQYSNISESIRVIIENILGCKDSDYIEHVNIVSVGYNFSDIDMLEILDRTLVVKPKVRIYLFLFDDDLPSHLLKYSDIIRVIRLKKVLKEIGGSKEYSDYSKIFKFIWSEIEGRFKKEFEPRGIDRHVILSELFDAGLVKKYLKRVETNEDKEKTYSKYYRSRAYYLDRTLVEILISFAQGRGRFAPRLLLAGKTGRYFSQFYNYAHDLHDYSEVSNDLYQIDENNVNISFIEFINRLNFSPNYDGSSAGLPIQKSSIDEIVDCVENLLRNHHTVLRGLNDMEFEALFDGIKLNFINLIESGYSLVRASFNTNDYLIFQNYSKENLLHTTLSLQLKLSQLLNLSSNHWDYIFIIAEYGINYKNFIEIHKNEVSSLNVVLLLADREGVILESDDSMKRVGDMKGSLIEYCEKNLDIPVVSENLLIGFLPYKMHNHHMTIGVSIDSQFVEGRAIYYYQRGLSNYINPIELKEDINLKFALRQFEKYLRMATVVRSNSTGLSKEKILGLLSGWMSQDGNVLGRK